MSVVIGIDPGVSGAIALYDTSTQKIVAIYDIPNWNVVVAKKKRKRVDIVQLRQAFGFIKAFNPALVVIEAVGGRPGQSASAGYVFGYTVGLLSMACMYEKLYVETIPPTVWKKVLKVEGKKGKMKKVADTSIVNRAEQLFVSQEGLFRNARGTLLVDRAEAAMLAKFGGDYVLPTLSPWVSDSEFFQLVQDKIKSV